MSRAFTPPVNCPVCGEAVPPDAKACPGCGADERSGWNEEATLYDDLELPDSAFADDDAPAPRRRVLDSRLWIAAAAVLAALAVLSLILH